MIGGVSESDRRGRSSDKFFLYDIVNNNRSGNDDDNNDNDSDVRGFEIGCGDGFMDANKRILY